MPDVTRRQIIDSARKWMKVPFHHQGRNEFGIDCIGLLVMVAVDLEIPHSDFTDYGKWPAPGRLRQGLLQSGLEEISLEEMGPGDIPTMTPIIERPELEMHVGIITDGFEYETIIHTHNMGARFLGQTWTGRVMEHRVNEKLRSHMTGAWRYPGLVV